MKYLLSVGFIQCRPVILYARMWIEIQIVVTVALPICVILYARMWIEINIPNPQLMNLTGHPLCEDVD